MNLTKKQIWRWSLWVLLLGSLGLSGISCGYFRPPRLWSCQCEKVCLERAGSREKVTQRACGHTPRQAARYAENIANQTGLSGCKRTATVCNKCLVSKDRYCRTRRRGALPLGGGGWIDDVIDWEPIDPGDDVVYEEYEDIREPNDPSDPNNWENDDSPNDSPNDPDDNNWSSPGDDDWGDDPGDDDWGDDPGDDDWGDDDWGDDDWGDDDWGDDDD